MENKNRKITLFILAGLVILSFGFFTVAQQGDSTKNIFLDSDQDGLSDQEERAYGTDPQKKDTDGDGYSDLAEIQSGYNPLKKAPGDKMVATDTQPEKATDSVNLTQNLANTISNMVKNPKEKDANGNSLISVEDVDKMASEALAKKQAELNITEFKREELKIKKQDYKGLSDEKKKQKMKEDFSNYAVAVMYILSSNSPKPLTSGKDAVDVVNSMGQKVIDSINTRSSSDVSDLENSGEKIVEQLKEVEVPEELVDLHLKAMSFGLYAKEFGKMVSPDPEDPVSEMVNLYQLQSYFENLNSFISEIESKVKEYDLTGDEELQKRLKDFGMDFSDYTSNNQSQ